MIKENDRLREDEDGELIMEPEREYDGRALGAEFNAVRDQFDSLRDRLASACGPNGCFADNTPAPVMKACDEADRAISQAMAAMRTVTWAIGRWELTQRNGEKF